MNGLRVLASVDEFKVHLDMQLYRNFSSDSILQMIYFRLDTMALLVMACFPTRRIPQSTYRTGKNNRNLTLVTSIGIHYSYFLSPNECVLAAIQVLYQRRNNRTLIFSRTKLVIYAGPRLVYPSHFQPLFVASLTTSLNKCSIQWASDVVAPHVVKNPKWQFCRVKSWDTFVGSQHCHRS